MFKKSCFAISLLALAACGSQPADVDHDNHTHTHGAPVPGPETIEIAGEYCSNFGDTQNISAESWTSAGEGYEASYKVLSYSNEENWAITQNPDDAEWDPSLFNLIVWTEPMDEVIYVCWAGTGFPTIEDADITVVEFDSTDPDVGGCSGFPWTRLALHCGAG